MTFDIDANGIVNVSAKDMATGKSQAITITASSGLAEDEVNRMVKEAESHSEEDRKRRREVEVRNEADMLIYQTEKSVNENRSALTDADVTEVEKAIAEAKEALKAQDISRIEAAVEALKGAGHALAERLYQKSSQEASSSGGPQGSDHNDFATYGSDGSSDDDVIDAEFSEAG